MISTDVTRTLQADRSHARIDPYVTPKIELCNQHQERMDTRVLPVIFRFTPQPGAPLNPGELLDVYIGAQR